MQTSDFFSFSSDGDLPARFFRGYAFCGNDLVIGEIGMERFKRDLSFREDGHYFLLRKDGQRFIGGADYKGNMKLFIYKSSDGWAFSNSFALLVDHIKARGWKLSIRPEHVETWNQKGSFWQQLWSFDTLAEEISLVPSHSVISIENGHLLIKKYEILEHFADYEAAMENFLNIWLGRAAALMRGPLKVDITGGVDSRINLALFLAAGQHFGDADQMTFNCGTYGRHKEDYGIAKKLSAKYGFSLNRALDTEAVSICGNERFNLWRLASLGSYSPLYMPTEIVHPKTNHVTGGGGEGHRPFYPDIDTRQHLERFRGTLPDAQFNSILQSIDRSIQIAGDRVPPMILHYREFRDRLHSGLLGNYYVRIMPLASRHLYAATKFKTPQELDRNQVLFDVMNALTPSLMTQPYDDVTKMPSKSCLANLLPIPQLNPFPGAVYSDAALPPSGSGSPFDALAQAAAHTNAKDIAKKAALDGKFNHPYDGIRIHNALLGELLSM